MDPRWDKFLSYLRIGHTREDAARLARLPGVVLRNAVAMARSGHEEYVDLFERIKLAEAESVDRYMERLDRAAEAGDFKAVKFGLEALRPERFRPQSGGDGAAARAATHVMTDEAAKTHLIDLAVKLVTEDPKARAVLLAALEGKDPPQLPEGELIVEEDGE